jgi:endonuclease/exonuclease/phosphatase family metal-dependent hydrolase
MPVNAVARRRDLSSVVQTTINLYNLRLEYFESIEKSFIESDLPTIVSGDFNTSGFMQFMRTLLGKGISSQSVSRNLFPTTWGTAGLKLWQIDYVIGKNRIKFEKHEDINPLDFSDHWGQKVWFEL